MIFTMILPSMLEIVDFSFHRDRTRNKRRKEKADDMQKEQFLPFLLSFSPPPSPSFLPFSPFPFPTPQYHHASPSKKTKLGTLLKTRREKQPKNCHALRRPLSFSFFFLFFSQKEKRKKKERSLPSAYPGALLRCETRVYCCPPFLLIPARSCRDGSWSGRLLGRGQGVIMRWLCEDGCFGGTES